MLIESFICLLPDRNKKTSSVFKFDINFLFLVCYVIMKNLNHKTKTISLKKI